MKTLLCALVMVGAVACGGTGVSDSTLLTDVPASDQQALCEEMVALWPERTVTCDGQMDTFGVDGDCNTAGDEPVRAECASFTVGDLRACFGALGAMSDADVCAQLLPAACEELFASGCFGAAVVTDPRILQRQSR